MKAQTPWATKTPEEALSIPFEQAWQTLEQRLGKETVYHALSLAQQGKTLPLKAPAHEPPHFQKTPAWMQKAKFIGVPSTVTGSYFHNVQYALSVPEGAVHLLPFFEHGGSVYAATNWQPSASYLHPQLAQKGLQTPQQQLAFSVSMLHAMGKRVGFDLVPHVDRFAETVFTHPGFFEWIHIHPKTHHVDERQNRDANHQAVEKLITQYLIQNGTPTGEKLDPKVAHALFQPEVSQATRERLLFGTGDLASRTEARIRLMQWVRQHGYDTVGQAGAAPYRPVVVKKMVPDGQGNHWPEFTLKHMQHGMRDDIVGNVTPYKLYHVLPDGTPDITRINQPVWDYLTQQTETLVKNYQFDFFRADMAHIQQSHSNPKQSYDLHRPPELYQVLKSHIQKTQNPAFGTFAESFLLQGIVSAKEDMRHKGFDVVLGPFQYIASESKDYARNLKYWLQRSMFHLDPFKVSLSSMTTDSDQPQHKAIFANPVAHKLRLFLGYFLPLPAYNGMGVASVGHHMHDTSRSLDDALAPVVWHTDKTRFQQARLIRQLWTQYRPLLEQGHTSFLPSQNPNLLIWSIHQWTHPLKDSKGLLAMANLDMHHSHDLEGLRQEAHELYETLLQSTNLMQRQKKSQEGQTDAPSKASLAPLEPGEVRLFALG
jgi:hypothetical protein